MSSPPSTPPSASDRCPDAPSPYADLLFSPLPPRDSDRVYLDAAEADLLDEIQLVQSKLTEARQRAALQKNRRLLRRNPSASDAIINTRTGQHHLHHHHSARANVAQGRDQTPQVPDVPQDRSRTRIISVSFRLPKKEHRESVRQQFFDRGLPPKAIFSLHGASEFPFVWVGTADGQPDVEANSFEEVYGEEHRTGWRSIHPRHADVQKLERSRYVPVTLPDEPHLLPNYDNFCENTLWPLLHYDYSAFADADNLGHAWSAYRFVNKKFAEAISEIYEDGDLIWVHNYHLMLLPSLLRESLWYAKIGFFLYTPFPSAEIFRIHPHRVELLRGVIGADLIGFLSYDYSRQFVSSCTRLLGLEGTPNAIEADPRVGRTCEVGIYPSGIDVRALRNHVSSKVVKSRVAELRGRFEGRKIVVGIDRLDDNFAGVPLKLLAFEQLLTDHPEMVGKVVLIQAAMLPRQAKSRDAQRTQQNQVNELVGRINSSFGTFAFSPVHYINTELSPTEIHALMCIGHACIVSTMRDGMGLVPHEWTVCQRGGNNGPIVLSEFSGAAQSFATALHVNPWSIDEMALKIKVALEMPDAARLTRNDAAYRFVTSHTASLWGFNFLEDLEQADGAQEAGTSVGTPVLDAKVVARAYLGTSAQSSPVSSSNVLSSMGSTFPGGLSPQLGADKLANVVLGPFGMSPRIGGMTHEQIGAFLARDSFNKNNFVSQSENQDASWVSPDGARQPKKRKRSNLLVFDLDGTLVPFQAIAKLGVPSQQVLNLIRTLTEASPYNFVVIVSSRDRETVTQWLGDLDVYLAAEDGAYFRAPGSSPWISLFRDTSTNGFIRQHNSSGQFSHTASTLDMNLESVPDIDPASNGRSLTSDTTDLKSNRRKSADALVDQHERRRKASLLSPVDGKSRGSAQSIVSLSNEAGLMSDSGSAWKSQVLPVMQHFAERTPGVVIEEGDATLTWHYIDSETDFGRWQARDLFNHLESFLSQRLNIDLLADEGRRRWVKVRPKGVDKSAAIIQTLEHIRDFPIRHHVNDDFGREEDPVPSIDFILCIGDDRADEGMFEFLRDEKRLEKLGVHCSPSKVFTCRVGSSSTAASFFLENTQRVNDVLEELGIWKLSQE